MTFETWFRLILSYFAPILAPVLLSFGLCGCVKPIKPIDVTRVMEAAIGGGQSRQSFPPGTLPPGSPLANTGITLEGDPLRETSAETFYPDGTPAVRVKTNKTDVFDSLLILGSGLSDENMKLLLAQQQFANSIMDRIDAKLAMFEPLLMARLQTDLQRYQNPGPPQDQTRMTGEKWAEMAQRFGWKMPAPGSQPSIQPVNP